MNFALNFKNLLLEKDFTQQFMAKKLNTTQQTVSRWINGQNEPDLATLIKLADIFNCSVDYLLGREDDFGIINSNESEYTSAEKRIIAIYRALTEREKVLFDNLVNSFEDSNSNSKKSSRA